MKNFQRVCFMSVLFLMSLTNNAFTEEKQYIVGVENIDYLPHYTGEHNQYTGFSRELFDAFARKKGYHFIYKPLPLKRLFSEFLDGQTDFKYPDNPDWSANLKKDKNIHYSTPVVSSVTGVMVLPENKTNNLEKFKNLGTMMGFTPTAYTELIKAGKIVNTDASETDFVSLLKIAILKRVDGVYIASDVGAYHLREILKTPDALVFNPNLPYDIQKFSLSSVKYPEIIGEFNEFLIKEKEFVERLKSEHRIIEKH